MLPSAAVRSAAGVIALAFTICATPALPAPIACAGAPKVGVADYARAEQMLGRNIGPKLRNGTVDPVWLPDGNRFWYREQGASGWKYVVVDPMRATKSPAFDAAALAKAVSAVAGKRLDAGELELKDLKFGNESGSRISFPLPQPGLR
jgi:hypothetical protein